MSIIMMDHLPQDSVEAPMESHTCLATTNGTYRGQVIALSADEGLVTFVADSAVHTAIFVRDSVVWQSNSREAKGVPLSELITKGMAVQVINVTHAADGVAARKRFCYQATIEYRSTLTQALITHLYGLGECGYLRYCGRPYFFRIDEVFMDAQHAQLKEFGQPVLTIGQAVKIAYTENIRSQPQILCNGEPFALVSMSVKSSSVGLPVTFSCTEHAVRGMYSNPYAAVPRPFGINAFVRPMSVPWSSCESLNSTVSARSSSTDSQEPRNYKPQVHRAAYPAAASQKNNQPGRREPMVNARRQESGPDFGSFVPTIMKRPSKPEDTRPSDRGQKEAVATTVSSVNGPVAVVHECQCKCSAVPREGNVTADKPNDSAPAVVERPAQDRGSFVRPRVYQGRRPYNRRGGRVPQQRDHDMGQRTASFPELLSVVPKKQNQIEKSTAVPNIPAAVPSKQTSTSQVPAHVQETFAVNHVKNTGDQRSVQSKDKTNNAIGAEKIIPPSPGLALLAPKTPNPVLLPSGFAENSGPFSKSLNRQTFELKFGSIVSVGKSNCDMNLASLLNGNTFIVAGFYIKYLSIDGRKLEPPEYDRVQKRLRPSMEVRILTLTEAEPWFKTQVAYFVEVDITSQELQSVANVANDNSKGQVVNYAQVLTGGTPCRRSVPSSVVTEERSPRISQKKVEEKNVAVTTVSTAAQTEDKTPDAVASNDKNLNTHVLNAKVSTVKATDTKATSCKFVENNPSNTKATHGKATHSKVVDSKPSDPKVVDAKATDGKATEAKVVDSKLSDAKATNSEVVDSKPSDRKVVDAKATDGKATEAKVVDSKLSDAKATDCNVDEENALPVLDGKTVDGVVVSLSASRHSGVASFGDDGYRAFFLVEAVNYGRRVVPRSAIKNYMTAGMPVKLNIIRRATQKKCQYEAKAYVYLVNKKEENEVDDVYFEGGEFVGTVTQLVTSHDTYQPKYVDVFVNKKLVHVYIPIKEVYVDDQRIKKPLLPIGFCHVGMTVNISHLKRVSDKVCGRVSFTDSEIKSFVLLHNESDTASSVPDIDVTTDVSTEYDDKLDADLKAAEVDEGEKSIELIASNNSSKATSIENDKDSHRKTFKREYTGIIVDVHLMNKDLTLPKLVMVVIDEKEVFVAVKSVNVKIDGARVAGSKVKFHFRIGTLVTISHLQVHGKSELKYYASVLLSSLDYRLLTFFEDLDVSQLNKMLVWSYSSANRDTVLVSYENSRKGTLKLQELQDQAPEGRMASGAIVDVKEDDDVGEVNDFLRDNSVMGVVQSVASESYCGNVVCFTVKGTDVRALFLSTKVTVEGKMLERRAALYGGVFKVGMFVQIVSVVTLNMAGFQYLACVDLKQTVVMDGSNSDIVVIEQATNGSHVSIMKKRLDVASNAVKALTAMGKRIEKKRSSLKVKNKDFTVIDNDKEEMSGLGTQKKNVIEGSVNSDVSSDREKQETPFNAGELKKDEQTKKQKHVERSDSFENNRSSKKSHLELSSTEEDSLKLSLGASPKKNARKLTFMAVSPAKPAPQPTRTLILNTDWQKPIKVGVIKEVKLQGVIGKQIENNSNIFTVTFEMDGVEETAIFYRHRLTVSGRKMPWSVAEDYELTVGLKVTVTSVAPYTGGCNLYKHLATVDLDIKNKNRQEKQGGATAKRTPKRAAQVSEKIEPLKAVAERVYGESWLKTGTLQFNSTASNLPKENTSKKTEKSNSRTEEEEALLANQKAKEADTGVNMAQFKVLRDKCKVILTQNRPQLGPKLSSSKAIPFIDDVDSELDEAKPSEESGCASYFPLPDKRPPVEVQREVGNAFLGDHNYFKMAINSVAEGQPIRLGSDVETEEEVVKHFADTVCNESVKLTSTSPPHIEDYSLEFNNAQRMKDQHSENVKIIEMELAKIIDSVYSDMVKAEEAAEAATLKVKAIEDATVKASEEATTNDATREKCAEEAAEKTVDGKPTREAVENVNAYLDKVYDFSGGTIDSRVDDDRLQNYALEILSSKEFKKIKSRRTRDQLTALISQINTRKNLVSYDDFVLPTNMSKVKLIANDYSTGVNYIVHVKHRAERVSQDTRNRVQEFSDAIKRTSSSQSPVKNVDQKEVLKKTSFKDELVNDISVIEKKITKLSSTALEKDFALDDRLAPDCNSLGESWKKMKKQSLQSTVSEVGGQECKNTDIPFHDDLEVNMSSGRQNDASVLSSVVEKFDVAEDGLGRNSEALDDRTGAMVSFDSEDIVSIQDDIVQDNSNVVSDVEEPPGPEENILEFPIPKQPRIPTEANDWYSISEREWEDEKASELPFPEQPEPHIEVNEVREEKVSNFSNPEQSGNPTEVKDWYTITEQDFQEEERSKVHCPGKLDLHPTGHDLSHQEIRKENVTTENSELLTEVTEMNNVPEQSFTPPEASAENIKDDTKTPKSKNVAESCDIVLFGYGNHFTCAFMLENKDIDEQPEDEVRDVIASTDEVTTTQTKQCQGCGTNFVENKSENSNIPDTLTATKIVAETSDKAADVSIKNESDPRLATEITLTDTKSTGQVNYVDTAKEDKVDYVVAADNAHLDDWKASLFGLGPVEEYHSDSDLSEDLAYEDIVQDIVLAYNDLAYKMIANRSANADSLPVADTSNLVRIHVPDNDVVDKVVATETENANEVVAPDTENANEVAASDNCVVKDVIEFRELPLVPRHESAVAPALPINPETGDPYTAAEIALMMERLKKAEAALAAYQQLMTDSDEQSSSPKDDS